MGNPEADGIGFVLLFGIFSVEIGIQTSFKFFGKLIGRLFQGKSLVRTEGIVFGVLQIIGTFRDDHDGSDSETKGRLVFEENLEEPGVISSDSDSHSGEIPFDLEVVPYGIIKPFLLRIAFFPIRYISVSLKEETEAFDFLEFRKRNGFRKMHAGEVTDSWERNRTGIASAAEEKRGR